MEAVDNGTSTYAVLDLIVEIAELRAENKRLRRRVRLLEGQRDRWKDESKAWKWGALRWARNG